MKHGCGGRGLWSSGLLAIWVIVGVAGAAWGDRVKRWEEEDFYRKTRLVSPYIVRYDRDVSGAQSVIGSVRYYQAREGDTFLDLARFYGLGYNEIEHANPGMDPWIPSDKRLMVLPTEWVLPQAEYEGVIVNIPEMRLYYYHPKKGEPPQLVSTYPVGLGRDDWRTPQGKFRISGKTKDPTWVLPESIRKERIEKDGHAPKLIPGGHPENPLGRYRLELTLPMYRIHGTNIPWGVGMQVSHGCVRLYPEDIEQLFPLVPVGTPGQFVYQPVKIGARDGRIYAEVHQDIYRLTPGLYREARRILQELGWWEQIDPNRLQRAVEEQTGVPLDITGGGEPLRPAWEPANDGLPHSG